MLGVVGLPDLLGEADRGQRASIAEPLVLRDRRPFGRLAELLRGADCLDEVVSRLGVDRDAYGDVVGVVSNPPLGDGLPRGGFDQHGVGDDLQPVGGPGHGRLVVAAGATAFVFVGEEGAITPPQCVDFADEAQARVGQFELGALSFLVGFERGVEPRDRHR